VFGSARKTALVEMTRQASALGANAVVGGDYEVLGEASTSAKSIPTAD
jgi:uncharacterized protein YbjQ (UPF0145 family)